MQKAGSLVSTEVDSPLGSVVVVADTDLVRLVDFHDRRDMATALARLAEQFGPIAPAVAGFGASPLISAVRDQLAEYFAGTRRAFDLPLAPLGSAFQLRVWDELRRIPFGETIHYGQLARRVGDAGAVRAVARANGQNFISIIIPCHRVIGADGTLTGYGGGLARKAWLIDHESRLAGANVRAPLLFT